MVPQQQQQPHNQQLQQQATQQNHSSSRKRQQQPSLVARLRRRTVWSLKMAVHKTTARSCPCSPTSSGHSWPLLNMATGTASASAAAVAGSQSLMMSSLPAPARQPEQQSAAHDVDTWRQSSSSSRKQAAGSTSSAGHAGAVPTLCTAQGNCNSLRDDGQVLRNPASWSHNSSNNTCSQQQQPCIMTASPPCCQPQQAGIAACHQAQAQTEITPYTDSLSPWCEHCQCQQHDGANPCIIPSDVWTGSAGCLCSRTGGAAQGTNTSQPAAAAASLPPGTTAACATQPEEEDDLQALFDSLVGHAAANKDSSSGGGGGGSDNSSFSSKAYNTDKGQRVVIVSVGGAITSVFVREPSGEVWECPPDQISFTPLQGGAGSHSAAAAAHGSTMRKTAPGGALGSKKASCSSGSGGVAAMSVRTATRLCQTLDSVQSSNRKKTSCSSLDDGGSSSRGISMSGSISASSTSSGVCSDSRRSSGSSHKHQHTAPAFGLLSKMRAYFAAQRVRRAQAYVAELDEAAHVAIKALGCQSFLLPRHWPKHARDATEQQRRLRVLLAAYRV